MGVREMSEGNKGSVEKQTYRMNQEHIDIIQKEWPRLEIVECLGEGGFGTVYKAKKHTANSDIVQTLAVKIVSLPRDMNDLNTYLWDMQNDEEGRKRILQELVEKAQNEIRMEMELKDPHIISIHDQAIIQKEDELGYYVLISMDLLENFEPYMKKNITGSQQEVEEFAKKVGCDICDALIACERKNIVHRDIKPNNILVNENGDFVLTDFGLAKEIDTMASRSSTGTPAYRAPEIESGKYGDDAKKIDIYSLGIVLYQICNYGRFPFLPPFPEKIGLAAQGEAYQKKMNGEKMPLPQNCSEEFGKVIIRACEFEPQNRYVDAESFKKAIMNPKQLCADTTPEIAEVKQQDKTIVNVDAYTMKSAENANIEDKKKRKKEKQKKKRSSIVIGIMLLFILLGTACFLFKNMGQKIQMPETLMENTSQKDRITTDEKKESNTESAMTEEDIKKVDLYDLFAQYEITYEEALKELEKQNLSTTENQVIKAELSKMENSHTAFEKGKSYYDKGFYKEAKEQLALVLPDDGYYADAEYMIGTYDTVLENSVIESAEQYASTGNYAEAITCLTEYLEAVESSVQADVALMKYQNAYADNVIQQANDLLAQKSYEEAVVLMENAVALLPENQAIVSKYEECMQYKPADLSVLPVPELTEGSYVSSDEQEAKDNIGNVYNAENKAISIVNQSSHRGIGSIYLGGNYDNLQFMLACGEKTETELSKEINVFIYLDDELVDSFRVTRSFAPIEFTYDITDKNIIKIEVLNKMYAADGVLEVIVSDVKAWNE